MNIRIAIVDDQAQARELLRQDLLARVPDGASVACFDGGEAFLSGFTPGDDALVFLDICMEGMNGIEVAQRVRKRSALPDRLPDLFEGICVRCVSGSSV